MATTPQFEVPQHLIELMVSQGWEMVEEPTSPHGTIIRHANDHERSSLTWYDCLVACIVVASEF